MQIKLPLFPLLLFLFLAACSAAENRVETAKTRLAQSTLKPIQVQTRLPILALQKNTFDPALKTISVYIEGDGYAYVSRTKPSDDPTPKNPVALDLAEADPDSNVIYLGRPCQYISAPSCQKQYWTTHRFASDVVQDYQKILDQLQTRYGNDLRFHLIGFSGGANIAGLLAASRDDIASLRTVAGNVDNDFFTGFHTVSPMPHSLNMADYPARLASIPQIHFIAADDRFVPVEIATSYRRKLPDDACMQMDVIPGTTHIKGWIERWPELKGRALNCTMRDGDTSI